MAELAVAEQEVSTCGGQVLWQLLQPGKGGEKYMTGVGVGG